MTAPLVLSLFPGVDLLGHAFTQAGFTVVHGPEWMFGGDVRDFHVPAGRFDVVIGGPPCQTHSSASRLVGTNKIDLIQEFVRVVREAQPRLVVMENVPSVLRQRHAGIPAEWHGTLLRDWDCGGHSRRQRAFFTWPFMLMAPPTRPVPDPVTGAMPSLSVMASTWKRGSGPAITAKGFLPGNLPLQEYGRIQGAEVVVDRLIEAAGGKGGRRFIIHALGNGVPTATGGYVARQAMAAALR